MITNAIFIGAAVSLLLIGCSDPQSTPSEPFPKPVQQLQVDPTPIDIGPPLDINALKREPWFETTSGVASKNTSSCWDNEDGFYGFYFLIDREAGGGPMGKLTIYKPRTAGTWRYEDEDEEFVEISLRTNRIKVWDRIAVGSSTAELLEFLKDHPHHRQGSSIVATLGEYQSEFQVLDDTVSRITVKRVCKVPPLR